MLIYATDSQLIASGAKPYTLATLWYWYSRVDGQYDTSRVDLSAIANAAAKTDPAIPLVMDIEHWDLAKPEEREPGICNLRVAALRLRLAHPSLSLGYYSLLPDRNYWAPVKAWVGLSSWDAKTWRDGVTSLRAWRDRNSANAADLLSLVDVLYPSIYHFYPGKPSEWRAYAVANLDEAVRIAKGRPVIPFMCPQYPDNAMVAMDEWRMMLDVVREYGVSACAVYANKPVGDEWRTAVSEVMDV